MVFCKMKWTVIYSSDLRGLITFTNTCLCLFLTATSQTCRGEERIWRGQEKPDGGETKQQTHDGVNPQSEERLVHVVFEGLNCWITCQTFLVPVPFCCSETKQTWREVQGEPAADGLTNSSAESFHQYSNVTSMTSQWVIRLKIRRHFVTEAVSSQATEQSEKLDKELKSLDEMEEQADSRWVDTKDLWLWEDVSSVTPNCCLLSSEVLK